MRYCCAYARLSAAVLIVFIVASTSEAGLFRRTRSAAPVRYETATPIVRQVSTAVSRPEVPATPCVPERGWSAMPRTTADFGRWPPYSD